MTEPHKTTEWEKMDFYMKFCIIKQWFESEDCEVSDNVVGRMTHRIQNLLLSERSQATEELRGKILGMKIKNPVCYCKTHLEHNCGVTSNDALEDILAILK